MAHGMHHHHAYGAGAGSGAGAGGGGGMGMTGGGMMLGPGDIDVDAWVDACNFLEGLPDAMSNWCFMAFKKEFYGDLKAYEQHIKPHGFVNVHSIKKRLKHASAKRFVSNADVLASFRTMFGNAFRYWYDPTPVAGAGGAGGKKKQAAAAAAASSAAAALAAGERPKASSPAPAPSAPGYEPRKNVIALVARFDDYVSGDARLVRALAREGVHFKPWFDAFPGAAYLAYEMEEWYKRTYTEAYWFYYRDGCYHGADPEDAWEDPADYSEFVHRPVYLADVWHRLYTSQYASPSALAGDMKTMFANARTYYGEDADFGAGKFCTAVENSFDKMWAAAEPRSHAAAVEDYLPPGSVAPPAPPPDASAPQGSLDRNGQPAAAALLSMGGTLPSHEKLQKDYMELHQVLWGAINAINEANAAQQAQQAASGVVAAAGAGPAGAAEAGAAAAPSHAHAHAH